MNVIISMHLHNSHQTTDVSDHVVIAFLYRRLSVLCIHRTMGIITVSMIGLIVALPSLISTLYVILGTHALSAVQDETTSQKYVTQAIDLLEQGQDWVPSDAHVYRRLAKAYGLNDQPELAVAALEQAYRLQPTSLLIQQELALAYKSVNEVDRALALWEKLHVTPTQIVVLGDEALDKQEYDAAIKWYNIALRYDINVEPELGLRRFLAAHLAGLPDATILLNKVRANDQSFEVYVLEDTVKINGDHLRWMQLIDETYGRLLNYGGIGGNNIGYLWWTGQAFAVVSVEQAGDYQISMHVLHDDVPPVEMAIGVNGQQIQQVSLGRGDNSWETITVGIYLQPGIQTIHVSFLNDAFMNGKDRNAMIKWLLIEKID